MNLQSPDVVGDPITHSAFEIVERINKETELFNSKREASIPRFDRDEIVLDKLIRDGSFTSEYSIHKVCLDKAKFYSEDEELVRNSVASEADVYTIKLLNFEKVEKDSKRYANESLNLVVEAKILSNLSHKNIIRLRGLSSQGVHGLKARVEGNFFLILDRSTCTLRDRQEDWLKTCPTSLLHRLQIGIEVAEALCYLQRKKVIHRNIKPENICFSQYGKPMLRDFGLSKILPNREDSFLLTGLCGTLRYMSPECATCRKYGMASDVYSFILLLWGILTLELPFRNKSRLEIFNHLKNGGFELTLRDSWSSSLKKCIRNGSSGLASTRPTIEKVHGTLIRQVELFSKVKDKENQFSQRHGLSKQGSLRALHQSVREKASIFSQSYNRSRSMDFSYPGVLG